MTEKKKLCPMCEERPRQGNWAYCRTCNKISIDLRRKNEAKKFICARGGRKKRIPESQCVRGCNDACFTCVHARGKKMQTIDSISREEENASKHSWPSIMSSENIIW